MIKVHLRSGKVIEATNSYSLVEKFIHENTGQAIVLTDAHDEVFQYLVRKDAIDYIETTIN